MNVTIDSILSVVVLSIDGVDEPIRFEHASIENGERYLRVRTWARRHTEPKSELDVSPFVMCESRSFPHRLVLEITEKPDIEWKALPK